MIKNNLSKILGERRIKMSQLAKMAQVGTSSVNRLYNEKTLAIDLRTVAKILDVLNLKFGDVIEYIPDSPKV